MTVRRQIKRIGGSLGVLLPRDIAEAEIPEKVNALIEEFVATL